MTFLFLLIFFPYGPGTYTKMNGETPLYDPELLENHNLGERHEILKLDNSLQVRPLRASDYGRGYLTLLKQLTEVGNISYEQFLGK